MTDLPELPEPIQRKLLLKWNDVIEKYRFTGEHLQWHQSDRVRRRRHMEQRQKNPLSCRFGEWFSPDYPEHVDDVGIRPTVAFASERFGQFADEYFRLWSVDHESCSDVFATWLYEIRRWVETEVARLWSEGGEWHGSWFERACRSKILGALETVITERTRAARKLEIERLERQQAGGYQIRDDEFQARLARAREAIERSQNARTCSRLRTDDIWQATQVMIADIHRQTYRQPRPESENSSASDGAELSAPVGRLKSEVAQQVLPGGIAMPQDMAQPGTVKLADACSNSLRSGHRRASRAPDPQLESLRRKVREMHKAGVRQLQMCSHLSGRPRPAGVAWKHLDWPAAYKHGIYGASVRKWLSAAAAS